MKLGYNNILTSLWFILMLGSGSTLAYMTFDKLLNSDLIFIAKFFVVLSYILTIGVLVFLLIKFRLVIVTKDKLISLHLFKFQKTIIHKNDIKSLNWTTWEIKAHKFISLAITDRSKNEVLISDFEFENFDSLVSSIIGDNYLDKSITHYKEQAKQNISLTNFIAVLAVIFLIICIGKIALDKSINYINAIFLTLAFATLLATLKRRNRYRQIEKYGI